MQSSSILRHGYLFVAVLCCLITYPTLVALNASGPSATTVFVLGLFALVIHGGLAILTAEFVWGSSPFWKRLSTYVIWISIGLFSGLLPSVAAAELGPSLMYELAVIPLVGICSQLPAWALRFLGRFCLQNASEPPVPKDKWSLRDFGIATVLVAVALAMAKIAMVNEEDWLGVALSSFVVPLFLGLPTALYVLLPKRVETALVGAAIHYVALLIGSLIVAGMVGTLRDPDFLGITLWMLASYVGGPVVGFLILRHCGWRLVRAI